MFALKRLLMGELYLYGAAFGIGFVSAIILFAYLYQIRQSALAKLLMVGTTLIGFWLLMEAMTFYIRPATISIDFQKAKFISVVLIPPLYSWMAVLYSGRKRAWHPLALFLFVIPLLSLLSLFTAFPYSFVSHAHLVYRSDIPVFSFEPHIGFFINLIYSYSNIAFCGTVFMIRALRSPALYRRQSLFIFVGTLLTLLVNILAISIIKIGPSYIDITSISILATLIILYWGLFRLPQSIMVPRARQLLVENIQDMAFVVDLSDKLYDINPAALKIISVYGDNKYQKSTLSPTYFIGSDIYDVLNFIPNFKEKALQAASGQSVFLVQIDAKYYHFYQSPIYDAEQHIIGKLFMANDVTRMQNYMNELEILNDEFNYFRSNNQCSIGRYCDHGFVWQDHSSQQGD